MEMISVCIYCDTTPWYTEEEMNEDNLCDLDFPRDLVELFYYENGNDQHNIFGKPKDFDDWYNNIYCADDTDGLFAFCERHGFIARRKEQTKWFDEWVAEMRRFNYGD